MRLFAVPTTPADVEIVADRCWQAGASGIWEAGTAAGHVSLRVGVVDERAADFVAALADLDPADVTDAEAVALATRSATVGPAGSTVTLTVPPGVFGDGLHPTTTACLGVLEQLVAPGHRLLDVGCGSGVLSVLAAGLGATVTAIDVDPAAVEATRTNAEANDVTVDASTTPLTDVTGTFDVVVANVSAGTLVTAAGALAQRCADDGALVLSGILHDRWPEVRDAVGGAVRSARTTDGWVTAVIDGAEG